MLILPGIPAVYMNHRHIWGDKWVSVHTASFVHQWHCSFGVALQEPVACLSAQQFPLSPAYYSTSLAPHHNQSPRDDVSASLFMIFLTIVAHWSATPTTTTVILKNKDTLKLQEDTVIYCKTVPSENEVAPRRHKTWHLFHKPLPWFSGIRIRSVYQYL